VIQNRSIEGAYDEAIEDAASRIHEASLPQRMIASSSISSSSSVISVGNTSSANAFVVHEKNDMVLSPPSDDNDINSDEISALGGDSSTSTSTYTDDDDIESNILYLEEKIRILKKAEIQREKEEAYIAVNAYDIINGREPSSRRTGFSSIWSEAKEMVEEFRVVGVVGNRSEEEEGNYPDLVSSSVSDVERRGITRSQSATDICLPLSSSSLDNYYVNNASPNRKRPKIDLSMVKQVSSSEFEKSYAGNEVTRTEDVGDHTCINGRSPIYQNCVSPTARWQQASDMQLATDSRNWISQGELKQIFALTNAAISDHRRSIITTGKGE